ncbi:MAG: ABC transporter ATP-binding protein [Firmicutes bacterium]|nr:ABC transporter ATP-binding protein [Bacillota bacterium]
MSDTRALVEVDGVTKTYRTRRNGRWQLVRAVRGVSFRIPSQHIVALVGESGSGKSTMAKLVTAVERPDHGHIVFDGRPIEEWRRNLREYRRHVQMVFQDPYAALNPLNTVRYAISRPLVNYRRLSQGALEAEIRRILETVHLTPVDEFLEKLPFELSGGQLQRVVTARALASQPRLIVADEPVSMLDVSIRAEILRLLDELRSREGVSILYITHDLISARMLADDIVVLYRGTVVEEGAASTVAKAPRHPYTQLLLRSIPNPWAPPEETAVDLSRIDRVSDEGGCVFRARCPQAMERCAEAVPRLTAVGGQQRVACWLYDRAEAGENAPEGGQPSALRPGN